MKPLSLISSSVLDNLGSGVLVFERDLRVSYVNQTAEMLLGVSARHVLGELPTSWMACQGDAVVDLIEASTVGSPITKRGVVLGTDRGEVTVDCTVTPILDENGARLTIVELQQVDRRNRISREERLITQQVLTREVVRGLAHEIKNPLGGLRGAAQLLDRQLDTDELHEYTNVIISEADRLAALVDTLLGPGGPPNKVELNIHELLEYVLRLVGPETGPGIRLRRDYDPGLPDMLLDRDQMVQALLNLVQNALTALDGQGQLTVRSRADMNFTIGETRHAVVASIEIEDDGPGIPADLQDSVFYPLVTSRADGTGLGLSAAQDLISRHGGLIEFESRPGRTVFQVRIPIAKREVADG